MACFILCSPSKGKGIVTIATVKIPSFFDSSVMIGAAPVPVPPPIPAVIKTILVLCPRSSVIVFILSMAASRPTSGLFPAPRPSVKDSPSCIFTGTGLFCNAWASVLHKTKSTSVIPCLNIWFTAFPPPPPTPITLMIEDLSFGRSKLINSSI